MNLPVRSPCRSRNPAEIPAVMVDVIDSNLSETLEIDVRPIAKLDATNLLC